MPPLTPWGRQYETPSRAPRSKHEDAAQQKSTLVAVFIRAWRMT
jgi:hypothetical protein